MWAYKTVDLVPHPVVAFVFQVENAERFPRALGFESLDPFLRVSKQISCITAKEKNKGAKRIVHFEFACEGARVTTPDFV